MIRVFRRRSLDGELLRLRSLFLWFTITLEMKFNVPSVFAYNAEIACRSQHPNSTASSNHYMFLKCPTWSSEFRYPAFCCGTHLKKTCCEWSTYVINYIGGGHTDIGLGVFVGLSLLGAIGVFCLCCGLFRYFCVSRWNRPANPNNGSYSRGTTLSSVSVRPQPDGRHETKILIPQVIPPSPQEEEPVEFSHMPDRTNNEILMPLKLPLGHVFSL